MDDLSTLSLADFLRRVADRSPTPGGGSVTGAAGAMACALASMVTAYSLRRDTDPGAREIIESAARQLVRSGQILQALITQDAVAYETLNSATKARRESPGNPAVEGEFDRAVFDASAVPMEMAAVASHTLAAIDGCKHAANRFLLSDLAIAAGLANATARSARATLQANARQIADESQRESLLADIDRILLHCASHFASIEAFVERHLEESD